MKFYLGVHRAHWLGMVNVPLMASRRLFDRRRSLPVATASWFLDSGGFTELSLRGSWGLGEAEYVRQARRLRDGVGMMQWAAPMDWMCEPGVRVKTGLPVEEHQRRTVANFLRLRSMAPDLPIIPVLQGWEIGDYERCERMYGEAGVDLGREPLVGLGTVCRRQATSEIEDIVLSVSHLRLHGFGVKITGLQRYGHLLASADSMAWSYGGRRNGTCPGRCGNHLHYALEWREKIIQRQITQLTRTVAGEDERARL